MGRLVDLDDRDAVARALQELITDSAGVAEMIGLKDRENVSTYRGRYDDFPEPVINLGGGRCLLWLRSDVDRWQASRRR